MPAAKTKRTGQDAFVKLVRFRAGIEWIAGNDEPLLADRSAVAEQISVQLLADIFEVEPGEVADLVLRVRKMAWAEV